MRTRRSNPGFLAILAVALALILATGTLNPAQAGSEDVAMFYEELSQYGQWVDYQNYGPVWMPSQVGEDWRPYTDGRWTPTEDGYVFETQEPWGWATYHYGNWMPTESYGWVWVPGRTWYPSTVTWRTSPEDAPVETSYIGWAPIPPPDYVPPPAYAPVGGYYSGAPVMDLITAPFYIFATAARFLLGFGQPFIPAYSYYGCGCLAPPVYTPVFFPRTIIVSNYYRPAYYPAGFMAGGLGVYSWGPRTAYVARVTRINQTAINQTIIRNTANLTRIHNVVPPTNVVSRHGHIREIMPPALAQGQRLPRSQPVRDVRLAQANLGKPNLIHAPKQVPQVPLASIPKASPLPPSGPPRGMAGAGLPSKATMPLTPKMQQQIGALPPKSQIVPAAPVKPPVTAAKPGVAAPPTAKPGVTAPAVPPTAKPGVAPPTAKPGTMPPTTKPGMAAPGAKPGVAPPTAKPSVTPPGAKPGMAAPGAKPGVVPPTAKPSVTPPTAKPGVAPSGAKPVAPAPAPKAPAMAPPSGPRPPVATTPRPAPAPTPPRAAPAPAPRPAAPPAPPRAAPAPAPRPAPAPAPPRAAPAPAPRPAPAPARPASPPPSKPASKPGEKKAQQ